MRAIERDVMLFFLAVSAGSADGWSYSGLGHAFVANMTGNTVLLGLAVSQNHGDLLHPSISLGCYGAGVAIASFLTRKVKPAPIWPRTISVTLFLEALILAGAGAGWVLLHRSATPPPVTAPSLHLLLACVALAIGLQSGAMLQLKIPGIVTTYITGTWTTLMNGLVRFTEAKDQAPKQKRDFEERLLMQGGVLAVYFLSAVLTGWLFRYMPRAVGTLSAFPVLIAAVYGMLRARRAEE